MFDKLSVRGVAVSSNLDLTGITRTLVSLSNESYCDTADGTVRINGVGQVSMTPEHPSLAPYRQIEVRNDSPLLDILGEPHNGGQSVSVVGPLQHQVRTEWQGERLVVTLDAPSQPSEQFRQAFNQAGQQVHGTQINVSGNVGNLTPGGRTEVSVKFPKGTGIEVIVHK